MSDDGTGDGPQLYEVRLTGPAEADIEAGHARLSEIVSLSYADRWQDALLAEMGRLALFPTRHAVAAESDLHDIEVRRMLYYGPSGRRRRGGVAYRILFYVVEPAEEEAPGVVRVLHVWHGAKRPKA